MIHLLLVEDHVALRTSLAFLLNLRPDMTVVGEAGTVADAREMLRETDVALIDLDLPDGSGIDLIPALRAANPNAAAILLTGSKDRLQYAIAIEQGATGVIYKADSLDRVIEAIQCVSEGKPIHSQSEIIEFMQLMAQHRIHSAETNRLHSTLTPREQDLLACLAQGLSDQEIADNLYVSVRTVQSHMMNLMDKLDVHSRLQALIVAVRSGLVKIE